MTQEKPKRTLEHALHPYANGNMIMQANDLKRKAEQEVRLATVFEAAAEDIRLLQAEVRRLATENSELKRKLAVTNFKTKPKRIFLLDGSGSMSQPYPKGEDSNRLTIAVDIVREFVTAKDKVVLFGEKDPPELDMKNEKAVAIARKGLNGASDLLPALEKVAPQLEKGFAHLVIAGDGYISDPHQSLEKLTAMMEKNPKLFVSIIDLGHGWGSEFIRIAQCLPRQRSQALFGWAGRKHPATETKEMLAQACERALLRMAEINNEIKEKAPAAQNGKPSI